MMNFRLGRFELFTGAEAKYSSLRFEHLLMHYSNRKKDDPSAVEYGKFVNFKQSFSTVNFKVGLNFYLHK